MARLIVHQEKIPDKKALISLCPFGAMEEKDGKVVISAACKMCRLCIKKGPAGAVELEEDARPAVDKAAWHGIAVYVDHVDDKIHPVTLELIGKALELAKSPRQPVYALYLGEDGEARCRELLHYGVDKIFCYSSPELARFRIEPYTSAFVDFVEKVKPSAILVGATTVGRQLAPRAAARMHTGLTADCTMLKMEQSTDLVQIRPAFGGNIMAQILTPNHRPQMATVRYKVMNAPQRREEAAGEIVSMELAPEKLHSGIRVLDVRKKEPEQFIESVDVLVAAGRGLKKREDLAMLGELADLLGGQLACSRPLAEAGWLPAKRQIGLSGRTVRPRLLITCGVSGAIQFVAGMDHADTIVAINQDPEASIFRVAHYGLVGDLYEIVPRLIRQIREGRGLL